MSTPRTLTLAALTAIAVLVPATGAMADYTGTLDGTTLVVRGTSANEKVFVTGDPTNFVVDNGADGTADGTFPIASVTEIRVETGGGDDDVSVRPVPTTLTGRTVRILGGDGNDKISGSDANDIVDGGGGNDLLDGQRGNDDVHGGSGDDTIQWDPGDGNDTAAGDGGDDTLLFNGSNANEKFTLTAGTQPNEAVLRRDIASVATDLFDVERLRLLTLGGTDTFDGGDNLTGRLKSTYVAGGIGGTNVFNGTDLPDTFETGDGNDTLSGGAGDDTFLERPASGNDTFNGGSGDDATVLTGTDAAETYGIDTPGGPVRIIRAGDATFPLLTDVQRIELDTLGGNDTVIQGGDTAAVAFDLRGGAGDDTLAGGRGDDTFEWSPGDGSDSVDGGTGTDTFRATGDASADNFAVSQNGGMVVVAHAADSALNRLTNGERVAIDGQAGDDVERALTDLPTGFALALSGGDGNDTLTGANGPDVVDGGAGTDTLTGGAGPDRFACAAPTDTITDASAEDTVAADCVPPKPDGPTGPTGPDGPTGPTGLPRGALGFARPSVKGDLKTLSITIRNTHTAPITIEVSGSERVKGLKRAVRFKAQRKTIPAGKAVTVKVKTSSTLLKALRKARTPHQRILRKPAVTVLNTATGGKATIKSSLKVR